MKKFIWNLYERVFFYCETNSSGQISNIPAAVEEYTAYIETTKREFESLAEAQAYVEAMVGLR